MSGLEGILRCFPNRRR